MKYSLLIGVICLAIFGVMNFVTAPTYDYNFVLGAIGGIGVGFLIGGIWGYLTKKTKKVVETKEKIVEVFVEKDPSKKEQKQNTKPSESNSDVQNEDLA